MGTKAHYCVHRAYRASDQNYVIVRIKWESNGLGDLERQIQAFDHGLKVAGGGLFTLEEISMDFSNSSAEYRTVTDPNLLVELQYHFGIKRDRRHKPPAKTETETETYGDLEE